MNLSSEQETQLQEYLIGQLEPICAADPKVLAMYIMALLKRDDMSMEQVREFCATELQDFLLDETKPFIGRLFDTLHEMTSRQSGGGSKDGDRARQKRTDSFEHEENGGRLEDRGSLRRSDDTRKRRSDSDRDRETTYDDSRDHKRRRGASEEDDERERSPRRGDRHRRDRGEDSRDVVPQSSPSSSRRHDRNEPRNLDRPLSSSRGRDEQPAGRWEGSSRDDRSSGRYDDRDQGRSGRGARDSRPSDFGSSRITGRKRGVCFDFEERGVCVRGESCEYEHRRPLVVDEAGLSKLSGRGGEETEEAGAYNPEDPFLKTSPIPVWHGPAAARSGPPMPRGGRGLAPGLLTPPAAVPLLPHLPQGVLPLPVVPMMPAHQVPYHGGDGLMPTPGSQPYMPTRGMRGMRGRGRGGYHGHNNRYDDAGSGNDQETDATDTASFGGGGHHRPAYDQGQGRGGFNRFKRGRYEGDYGHRHGGRPPKPQTESICVARIPPELNTIAQLNAHFQKFGTIVNMQLDPANKQAFVQFTSNAEALLALRSPEAVMGNRFIQVYLKKDEAQEGAPPAAAAPAVPQPRAAVPAASMPARPPVAAAPVSAVPRPAAPAAASSASNLEALKKKQQELLSKQLEQQKKLMALLEKMPAGPSKDEVKAQLLALTAKIGEAMKRVKEGVAKQQQQQKAAAAPAVAAAPAAPGAWKKLSAESEKQRLDRELDLLAKTKPKNELAEEGSSSTDALAATTTTSSQPSSSSPSPSLTAIAPAEAEPSRVAALQRTLASLQEEAKKLGIPASQIAAQVAGVPTPSLRGPRGRGLGMRARAAPWWGRGRGRGRGRGGFAGGGGAAFKLDNRTTVVCVHDVPDELRNEALLRAHFQAFGEVISLAPQPDTHNFLVQFTQRFMAEQAMHKGATLQGQPLTISWHDSTQSAAGAEAPEFAEGEAEGQAEGEAGEEVEEYQGGDSFVQEPFPVAEEEEEVDIDLDDDTEERSWKRD